ncbi:MAG: sugar ABC transporter permease [Caldilineaceae bacterium]|nr:sugar ABC transporter permease [Caldilineaceae bacterium]
MATTTETRPRKPMGQLQRRRMLGDWLLLAPQFILFAGLTLLPFVVAIPMLFTDQLSFQDTGIEWAGFSNFTRIFTDSNIQREYLPALQRTLVFVTLNYLMVYVFGLTLALLIYEIGFRGWFFTIVYLPMMVSGLATGYMATMLFAKSTGTVNLMLGEWFGARNLIDIQNPTGTAIILPIMIGWRYAGFNVAIFLSGLLAIPTETIEAATVDGASYWQRLWRIYFPQMLPSFIIATIFCLIGSFGVFDELIPLGALSSNNEAKLLSVLFFTYAFTSQRLALGLTLTLQTFLPLVFVALLLQRLQRRLQY